VTQFAYTGGNYDRYEKQFFGFADVVTTLPDNTQTEDQYENQALELAGVLDRELRRDNAGVTRSDRVFTNVANPVLDAGLAALTNAGACTTALPDVLRLHVANACTPFQPIVNVDMTSTIDDAGHGKTRTVTYSLRDRFGHVQDTNDTVDGAVSTDDTYTVDIYTPDTMNWILDEVQESTLHTTSFAGPVLRDSVGHYDGFGDLVQLDVTTGIGTATTVIGYDTHGSLNHIQTPPNAGGTPQTYDVTFDATTATYPVAKTNGFGDMSTADYDLKYGIATSEVDVAGSHLTRQLDTFGRITGIAGPYEAPGSYAITTSYNPYPTPSTPPYAVTTTFTSAPSGYGPLATPITTVTFVDGLSRVTEQRKTAVVDDGTGGQSTGMTTTGWSQRDFAGRVSATYPPVFTSGASTAFLPPTPFVDGEGPTQIAYDHLSRPQKTTYPDSATDQVIYDIATAPSPSGLKLYHATHTDPNGHIREVYTDEADRVRAVVEHPSSTAVVTQYDYLASGDLSKITDAEGDVTTLGYDLRGLRTTLTSGDTGTVHWTYDLMGNVATHTEPNLAALGATVSYTYDHDRLLQVTYPTKPAVHYQYLHGRISDITDETGEQSLTYGALGEVTRTVRTVTPVTGPTKTFDTHYITDSLGRQLAVTYPDGTTITNTYDAGGQLRKVDGSGAGWTQTYADCMTYDKYGHRVQIRLGNHAVTKTSYELARVRLSTVVTSLPTGAQAQNLLFHYDPASNIKEIDNNVSPLVAGSPDKLPGTSSVTYTYDGSDQLAHADGTAQLDSATTTTYHETFEYSPSHNIQKKTRVHTVGANNPTATNFSSKYDYSTRPHLPDSIGSLNVTYDHTGNPIKRADSTAHTSELLTWDDDDRLIGVKSDTAKQSNKYDAAGLRVVRSTETDQTIFASPYFDDIGGGSGMRHIFAGSTRIASVVVSYPGGMNPAASPEDGTPHYFHDDHLGSTSVVTDANGKPEESLEYFVDGETWLDRAPTNPINGYLFSGKPFDRDTGLYDFGQRFYDPRTSMWLGLDAAYTHSTGVAIGSPTFLAVSGFAKNNPVGVTDRDGRMPTELPAIIEHVAAMSEAPAPTVFAVGGGGTVLEAGVAMSTAEAATTAAPAVAPASAAIGGGIIEGAAVLGPVSLIGATAYLLGQYATPEERAAVANFSDNYAIPATLGAAAALTGHAAAYTQATAEAGAAAHANLRNLLTSAMFMAVLATGKAIPNPDGSRGGPQHRATIQRRIDELVSQGHEHVGGGQLKEIRVPTPGGSKSYRRPDITTRAPDGTTYRENVGRSKGDGSPIAREQRALDDIEGVTGARPGFTPYDK
jgi:RHS repeat-associated protein